MAKKKIAKTKENQNSQEESVKETTEKDYIHAYGRRKTATARIRLFSKTGEFIVNDKPISEYFPGEIAKTKYQLPFVVTDTVSKFSATLKVSGSGKAGQLDAVVHAFARALINVNPKFRQKLKPYGLLTRDPRAKERRKYGLAQKARKGKQSPKR